MVNNSTALMNSMETASFRARTVIDDRTRTHYTTRLKVCTNAYMLAHALLADRGPKDRDDIKRALTSMLNCVGDWLGVNVGKLMLEMGESAGIAATSPWELARTIYPDTSSDEFLMQMLKASGMCAKALEAHDHLEPYPCREVLNANMPILLIGLIADISENTMQAFKDEELSYYSPLFVAGWGAL